MNFPVGTPSSHKPANGRAAKTGQGEEHLPGEVASDGGKASTGFMATWVKCHTKREKHHRGQPLRAHSSGWEWGEGLCAVQSQQLCVGASVMADWPMTPKKLVLPLSPGNATHEYTESL